MKGLFMNILVALCVMFSAQKLNAQTDNTLADTTSLDLNKATKQESISKNIIKINLLAITLRTLTLQYERVINKYLSVAIAGRYMPKATVPFKTWIYNKFGDNDPDFEKTLDNMLISNYAFTPELRFYLGKKGYGRGFYLAPSYRYSHFTLDNLLYTYYDENGQDSDINMSGDMTSNFGGFTLGAQWALGKHLSLDWWIFAPFFGVENTTLSGITTAPLSEEAQNSLRLALEDIEIPSTTTTVSVHKYGASIQLQGLMTGISTGLAFGVRF